MCGHDQGQRQKTHLPTLARGQKRREKTGYWSACIALQRRANHPPNAWIISSPVHWYIRRTAEELSHTSQVLGQPSHYNAEQLLIVSSHRARSSCGTRRCRVTRV